MNTATMSMTDLRAARRTQPRGSKLREEINDQIEQNQREHPSTRAYLNGQDLRDGSGYLDSKARNFVFTTHIRDV